MPTEEKSLQKRLIDALGKLPGVWVYRNNTGMRGHVRYGIPGQADLSGILRGGRRLEIEVKGRDPKKCPQSDEQKEFQRRIEELGGCYILARDFDETIDAVLRALEEEP